MVLGVKLHEIPEEEKSHIFYIKIVFFLPFLECI
jgi:hypothetical protein